MDSRKQGLTDSDHFENNENSPWNNSFEDFTRHTLWYHWFMRHKVLVMKAKTKIAQRMSDGFEIKICALQTYFKQ